MVRQAHCGGTGLRLVILGPPGSGKGTRAKIIGKLFDIPVITTGDLLRSVVDKGTKLGKLADNYMKKGDLVRDDIVISIVEDRLIKPDVKNGFVLDGFPRSVEQAEALDRILNKLGIKVDAVVNVTAKPETIIERLSLRRICSQCNSIYHLNDIPPKKAGKCDECGGELIQRNDDHKEIIQNRLEVYLKQTFPILERYEKRGLGRNISGELEIDKIPTEVERVLKDL